MLKPYGAMRQRDVMAITKKRKFKPCRQAFPAPTSGHGGLLFRWYRMLRLEGGDEQSPTRGPVRLDRRFSDDRGNTVPGGRGVRYGRRHPDPQRCAIQA